MNNYYVLWVVKHYSFICNFSKALLCCCITMYKLMCVQMRLISLLIKHIFSSPSFVFLWHWHSFPCNKYCKIKRISFLKIVKMCSAPNRVVFILIERQISFSQIQWCKRMKWLKSYLILRRRDVSKVPLYHYSLQKAI